LGLKDLYRIFYKCVDILNKALKWIIIFILAEMTVVVFLQIFFRYVIKSSLPWSEEFARYSLIWLVMLSAGPGFEYKEHIGLDILVDILKGFKQKIVKLSSYIIVGLFDISIIIWGFKVVDKVKFQISPAMRVPMKWFYLAVPVGGLIILIEIIKSSMDLFFKEGEDV
jgi:TRAP-type transport system small permease protein